MLKIGALILALSSLSSVFAECDGTVHCQNVSVDRMYVTTEGTLYVGTSGNEKNLSCTASNGEYLTLNESAKNYSAIYSLLLANHIAQHPVWLRMNVTGTCNISYVVSDR